MQMKVINEKNPCQDCKGNEYINALERYEDLYQCRSGEEEDEHFDRNIFDIFHDQSSL